MIIRQANPGDLDALVRLNRHVQGLHAAAHPALYKDPADPAYAPAAREELAKQLASPEVVCLVAAAGREITGYALIRRCERPPNCYSHGLRYLELDQIAVDPQAQRTGYGRALVGAVRQLAADEGYDVVSLSVWAFNRRSRAFFEKMGFAVYSERRWLWLEEEMSI